MVAATGFTLTIPWITGTVLIDEVIIEGNIGLLPWIAIGLVGLVLLGQIFSYLQDYTLAVTSQKIIHRMRIDFYEHVQHLPIRFFETRQTGDLVSRVTNDVEDVEDMITYSATILGVQLIMFVGAATVLFYLNFWLTILVFVTFPVLSVTVYYSRKRIRRISRMVKQTTGEIAARAEESISGIRIVKAFTREDFEVDRFAEKSLKSMKANVHSSRVWSIYTTSVEMITIVGIAIVIWFATPSVIIGAFTVGQLVAYLAYLTRLYNPIIGLSKLNLIIQKGLAATERLFEVMDVKRESVAEDGLVPKRIEGRVKFANVSFGYDVDRIVLKNINIEARPGEVVALVGRSGAGKTTIASLIARFYDPLEGVITLDDYQLSDLKLSALREQIGLVLQETFLYSGSVRENISYGNLTATDEEITDAARAANAHKFILRLPHGYDTEIGERGVKLSSGERQRIAIARAVLKDPKILILDEATSNVDSESEAFIQEALERLMIGRTSFIIAHRISAVIRADKIVVIEDGQVVEVGTHEELLAKEGVYTQVYQTQLREKEQQVGKRTLAF